MTRPFVQLVIAWALFALGAGFFSRVIQQSATQMWHRLNATDAVPPALAQWPASAEMSSTEINTGIIREGRIEPRLIVRFVRTSTGTRYELGDGITPEQALQALAAQLPPRLDVRWGPWTEPEKPVGTR